MPTDDARTTARAKLLAELPHVGTQPVASVAPPPTRNTKSSHPAFAEYGDFDDIETSVPLSPASQRRSTRFVDQAHIDDEWEHDDFDPRTRHARSPQAIVHRQRQSHRGNRPRSPLGGVLSGAHEQVAPFAGLIVTAALLATAGLLFHMLSSGGKSNVDLDEYALPGFRVEALEETLPSSESAPLAEVSVPSETPQSESLKITPADVKSTDESAKAKPAIDASAQLVAPITEPTVELTMPLGQLSFPQTTTPRALDYSKATDPDLQQLPEIAGRPEPAASEAINR